MQLTFRYPQRLGWQMKITRKDIRSSEAYFRLHNFLISETGNGNISRQETVSMIPPLLLDIKPSDKVKKKKLFARIIPTNLSHLY